MSPADYVIDFLRCTIQVEDPYVVAVLFEVFKLAKIATCLRTCRVKNNFTDKKLPRHIQTNALMNLQLLYPSTAEEFAESGMFGEFDESMAGKCLMVCELQITMKDFLQIKRLQHCYYDLTRVKRDDLAAFLLSSGPFIDPNTLKEKVPSVVKELASTKKRLSTVVPVPAGRALAGGLAAAEESPERRAEAARIAQLEEEVQKLQYGKDSAVKALEEENAELRRKLRESFSGDPSSSASSDLPGMVGGILSSLPPMPFLALPPALAAEDEERARWLFQLALAKGRKNWNLNEAPKEIDRPTFVELIQNVIAAENEAVAARGEQQTPPSVSIDAIGDIFDKADLNGNSTVSEEEFIALFAEVKAGLTPSFLGSAVLFGVDGFGGLAFQLR